MSSTARKASLSDISILSPRSIDALLDILPLIFIFTLFDPYKCIFYFAIKSDCRLVTVDDISVMPNKEAPPFNEPYSISVVIGFRSVGQVPIRFINLSSTCPGEILTLFLLVKTDPTEDLIELDKFFKEPLAPGS